jgi:DNA mismatch endonuclease (patch repair protein)
MDHLSPSRRSENMRRIRGTNTSPERLVRHIVYALGYRYRLHAKELPGKPDIVFRPRKKAIFVHGCFWHLHTACSRGRIPASNRTYWEKKLKKNTERDAANAAILTEMGWAILVIWECETADLVYLAHRINTFLRSS